MKTFQSTFASASIFLILFNISSVAYAQNQDNKKSLGVGIFPTNLAVKKLPPQYSSDGSRQDLITLIDRSFMRKLEEHGRGLFEQRALKREAQIEAVFQQRHRLQTGSYGLSESDRAKMISLGREYDALIFIRVAESTVDAENEKALQLDLVSLDSRNMGNYLAFGDHTANIHILAGPQEGRDREIEEVVKNFVANYIANRSIQTPLDPPIPQWPLGEINIDDDDFLFSWRGVSDAISYQVQVAEDPSFNALSINDTVQGPTYKPDILQYATHYFWRVRSQGKSGQMSTWSSIQEFSTAEKTLEDMDPNPTTPEKYQDSLNTSFKRIGPKAYLIPGLELFKNDKKLKGAVFLGVPVIAAGTALVATGIAYGQEKRVSDARDNYLSTQNVSEDEVALLTINEEYETWQNKFQKAERIQKKSRRWTKRAAWSFLGAMVINACDVSRNRRKSFLNSVDGRAQGVKICPVFSAGSINDSYGFMLTVNI